MLRGWVWVKESDGLGEETPPKFLSFCHQAAEALTRWQQSEKTVTGVIWVLGDFDSSETVVLAPWCKSLHLIQVCGLVIVGNEAQNHSIISKFDNRCGSVRGHTVMCVESVEQGTQDTTLWLVTICNKLQIVENAAQISTTISIFSASDFLQNTTHIVLQDTKHTSQH